MAGSHGVYGNRFAGTGQKHSLRYNSWLTVIKDGTRTYVRWQEFYQTYCPLLDEAERVKVAAALHFDGVFHAKTLAVMVGKIKGTKLRFKAWWEEVNERIADRGFVELDECDARMRYNPDETIEEAVLAYIDDEIEAGWDPTGYDRESDDGGAGDYGPEESLVSKIALNVC
jgi:hypothetical protein